MLFRWIRFYSSARIFWRIFQQKKHPQWIAGKFEKSRVFCIRLCADPLPRASAYFRLLPPLPFCWWRGSSSGQLILSDFLLCLLEMSLLCTQRAKIIYAAESFARRGNVSHAGELFTPRDHSGRRTIISKVSKRRKNHSVFQIQAKEKGSQQAAKLFYFILLPDPLPLCRLPGLLSLHQLPSDQAPW